MLDISVLNEIINSCIQEGIQTSVIPIPNGLNMSERFIFEEWLLKNEYYPRYINEVRQENKKSFVYLNKNRISCSLQVADIIVCFHY